MEKGTFSCTVFVLFVKRERWQRGGEAKGGVDPQYVWGGIPWTIILECCSGLSRLLLTPFALDMGVSAVTAHAAAACRVISMAEG